MTIQWKLQTLKIKDLKKHPKNPRTLSRDQFDHLKKSLETFGTIEKPCVNQDMTIIGGHQRIQVLKLSGQKEIECWWPDRLLSDKEAEELLIRLNKSGGEFDFDSLANNFDLPDLLDWGFNVDELELVEPEAKEKKKKQKFCPHCQGEI